MTSGEISTDADPSRKQLRWGVYGLLIALAVGNLTGRILAVTAADRFKLQANIDKQVQRDLTKFREAQEKSGATAEVLEDRLRRKEVEIRSKRLNRSRPFLSGNDRSRWLTIRALVEDGTYSIDHIVTDEQERAIWDTIDMVKHDQSGEPHLYSSKPTLLPTLLAGQYWALNKATGLTLRDDTHAVVRMMLLPVNIGCMLIIFLLTAKLCERFGATDWGRFLVVAAATFGTLLTTFAVVLNNHLIAAASASIALYAWIRIWHDKSHSPWYFVAAGFFGAFTAANELPALSFFALLGLALLCKAPRSTLLFGLPAASIVIAAALGTNYAAHKTVVPPYYFRAKEKDWTNGNWYNYSYELKRQTTDGEVVVRTIPSYWKPDAASIASRAKIDQGENTHEKYILHCLIGHHGIFSLTPIWLLSLVGAAAMFCGGGNMRLRPLAALIAIPTIACLGFYLLQGVENRNYGGTSSGLRWMIWFAPLWLCAMIPAADWSAGRLWRRLFAGLLLALSVMSASFPTWNPWSHPWISRLLIYLGWLEI
ncbi:MAG: hypothetical protein VB835_13765 [Pirellulales bacterium]